MIKNIKTNGGFFYKKNVKGTKYPVRKMLEVILLQTKSNS